MRIGDLKTILGHYGPDNQKLKAVEELTELQETIIKDVNKGCNVELIIDELADVYIMLEQIRLIYDIAPSTIDFKISEKIYRQLERMKNE